MRQEVRYAVFRVLYVYVPGQLWLHRVFGVT